jgi:hypothetical protein
MEEGGDPMIWDGCGKRQVLRTGELDGVVPRNQPIEWLGRDEKKVGASILIYFVLW